MEYKIDIQVNGILSFNTQAERETAFNRVLKLLQNSGLQIGEYSIALVNTRISDFTNLEEKKVIGHLDEKGKLTRH